ncbi:MAG: hypothetical protein ACREV6_02120 [Clostridium sp.]|uniref:hypothetical protein n=1 Tax=Clostridium sp. TaxID=1506 RepID=UPI003D6D7C54
MQKLYKEKYGNGFIIMEIEKKEDGQNWIKFWGKESKNSQIMLFIMENKINVENIDELDNSKFIELLNFSTISDEAKTLLYNMLK